MTITDRDGILAAELARLKAHLEGLPLTPDGRAYVLERFSAEQARPVKGTQRSLASLTNRQTSSLSNETESYFEYNHLFLVDADPATVSFRTQALEVTVHPDEPMDGGRIRHHGYQIYPDVLIVELGRVVARDLMRESELVEIEKERPWYIHRDPGTRRWLCPSATTALAHLGIEYEIVSDAEHNVLMARSCRYLADFLFRTVAPRVCDEIVALVRLTPGISIRELIEEGLTRSWVSDDVLAIVAQRVVFFDIERNAADVQHHARLYVDAATGRAYADAHPPSWAPVGAVTIRPSVAQGTGYVLGTRALSLYACHGDKVLFKSIDEVGCPIVTLTRLDFERYAASGILVPDAASTLIDQARAGALAAWQASTREAQEIALIRWRALEIWRANRAARRKCSGLSLPIPVVDGGLPSERTLERWDAASLRSDRLFGDHLVGLLPRPRRGRPGDRLSPAVVKICRDAIDKYWKQPVGRSKKALVRRVRLACKTAGILDLPDPKSIIRLLHKGDPYEMARAHDGDKAAYPARPYLPVDPDATPVHGLYPFQRVHYDTTTTDVETIDLLSGRTLGRSTLGYLIDAYSDRELARGWTYGGPTAYDVLQALVMCAERWGRLPEELVLDNAMSHIAVPIKVFCTIHRIDITYRPKSQGRFGGPVELAFGRITDELLHQVRGNTKAMKLIRQVTPAVDAKHLAALSLPDLDYLLDLWVQKVEESRIVQRLGKTVRVAFEDGLVQHGARESRRVVVDELFQMGALVPRGTRIARGPIGVFVDYLYYRHPCFGCHGVKRTRGLKVTPIEVNIDPRNITRLFAFIPAHYHGAERIEAGWHVAINYLLRAIRVVSSDELAIASTQAKARLKDDARKRVTMEHAIAEVLLAAERTEDLNLAGLRSMALQAIRESPATRAASPTPMAPADLVDDERAHDADINDPMAGLDASIDEDYFKKYEGNT